MSINIYCEGKNVLHLRNASFGLFHERMRDLIIEGNLNLNENLKDLLDKMDQNIYGAGCVFEDIADHIKNKRDLLLFAYIVKKSIETDSWKMPEAKEIVDHLWDFHAELLKYGEKLS